MASSVHTLDTHWGIESRHQRGRDTVAWVAAIAAVAVLAGLVTTLASSPRAFAGPDDSEWFAYPNVNQAP